MEALKAAVSEVCAKNHPIISLDAYTLLGIIIFSKAREREYLACEGFKRLRSTDPARIIGSVTKLH